MRSKGTLYFTIHPQGLTLLGRWVGLSYDGSHITGLAGIAQDPDTARSIVSQRTEAVSS